MNALYTAQYALDTTGNRIKTVTIMGLPNETCICLCRFHLEFLLNCTIVYFCC